MIASRDGDGSPIYRSTFIFQSARNRILRSLKTGVAMEVTRTLASYVVIRNSLTSPPTSA